ncbi:deaminase [Pseudoroseomonas cervicalis]|uniref:deaminase n=1 Tax=Teichococcus cervicalis TaxID=204525 RepID=UPI0035F0B33A
MSNPNSFEGRPDKLARWDSRYIGLAHHIAQWSKDPRAKVGAVLVNQPQARIVATGFNGFPSNVEDSAERLQDKATKLRMMVHAEQNALLHAGHNARGCDAYVVGKPVCNTCATLLIQAGVKRVVAAAPARGHRLLLGPGRAAVDRHAARGGGGVHADQRRPARRARPQPGRGARGGGPLRRAAGGIRFRPVPPRPAGAGRRLGAQPGAAGASSASKRNSGISFRASSVAPGSTQRSLYCSRS